MLHLPVGQEQPVGAEEDTVSPIDAAQPDGELGSFQHAANLGAERSVGIQRCQCFSGASALLCQLCLVAICPYCICVVVTRGRR